MSQTLDTSVDIREEILRWKEKRNAVILAHNYQIPEIQDIADYVGDSLGLAFHAQETDADVIAFCGVHFMAETAKIVNPKKTVILPDANAGCSLEESCQPEDLAAFLKENEEKNYYVITYINSSAAVKALSDVICTSGNAVQIVEAAPKDRPILFAPDQNLGEWVSRQTGREMEYWEGNCYLHVEFTRESISRIKEEYPDAAVVAHPECTKAVRLLADEVCSTEKMVHYCRDCEAENIIVVTEAGMLHRLRKECPDKNLIAGPTDRCACADCRFMKLNTMEKLLSCLKTLEPEVTMDEAERAAAEAPLQLMLDLSKTPAWDQRFLGLFDRCTEKYQGGNTDFNTYFTDVDLELLESIGYRTRELFDFVEDLQDYGEPSREMALRVATVRRAYYIDEMERQAGKNTVLPSDLPERGDELSGIAWLPRILTKARGKLRGELDPDIMYGCGGDRKFLAEHGLDMADFLRAVWRAEGADDPDQAMVDYVKSASA